LVKPGRTRLKPYEIKGSQESEQIKSGPLCGLLAPPETVKPGQTGQTQSNQRRPQSRWPRPNQTQSNRIKPIRSPKLFNRRRGEPAEAPRSRR
jgi:hypothetical protein